MIQTSPPCYIQVLDGASWVKIETRLNQRRINCWAGTISTWGHTGRAAFLADHGLTANIARLRGTGTAAQNERKPSSARLIRQGTRSPCAGAQIRGTQPHVIRRGPPAAQAGPRGRGWPRAGFASDHPGIHGACAAHRSSVCSGLS